MSWAEEELAGIDLGDKRLNKRAVRMLDCFSGKPTLSIPGACNGWPDTLAAYRFFEHEEVEWTDILSPHQQQTRTRMQAQLLFDPEEIQAAYLLSKKRPPKSVPRLNDVIRLIAQLGGFLGRKSDGEPGVKTLWLGLQRLVDFIAGMHAARDFYV